MRCEVHHSPDWAAPDGRTDADTLFFACGPDHKLLTNGYWSTTLTNAGRLAWANGQSPPQINHTHQPEELLQRDPDLPQH